MTPARSNLAVANLALSRALWRGRRGGGLVGYVATVLARETADKVPSQGNAVVGSYRPTLTRAR